MSEKRRKRVWVKTVDVSATALEIRLDVAAAQGLGPDQQAAAKGVRELLQRARNAANRIDPRPSRWAIWWRGAAADPAFQNLHAAMASMVEVYDESELLGEMQTAAARQRKSDSPIAWTSVRSAWPRATIWWCSCASTTRAPRRRKAHAAPA